MVSANNLNSPGNQLNSNGISNNINSMSSTVNNLPNNYSNGTNGNTIINSNMSQTQPLAQKYGANS
jgi:hypothetical protein